ncbi:MAG: hypothetical protein Q8L15_15200 [Methylobacter sp.]|nr:hypothetical protein [Methylobacter sp.]
MSANPFASFEIHLPKKYQESVKKYCRTGNKETPESAPFERQVDFWFMAFLIAVNKKLDPVKDLDTYNATAAHILDAKRISLMQLAVLGITERFEIISEHREVFNYCLELANAGMPHLIQVLNDPEDRPLWAILSEVESLTKIRKF